MSVARASLDLIGTPKLVSLGTNDLITGTSGAADWVVLTNGVERLRIASDGTTTLAASVNFTLANDDYFLSKDAAGTGSVSLLKADSTDNTVLNAGTGKTVKLSVNSTAIATLSATALTFSPASMKIVPGATELLFRNTTDAATTLAIANSGAITAPTSIISGGSVTIQSGAKLHAYSGGSGAGTKPTNLEIVSEGSGNGGYDNAGPDASTRGYYFSNVSAAYDGAIEYASRVMTLKAASTSILSLSSTTLTTTKRFFPSTTGIAIGDSTAPFGQIYCNDFRAYNPTGPMSATFQPSAGTSTLIVGTTTNHAMDFYANNAARWRIQTTGELRNLTAGNESTGAGTALLSTNCPAVTVSAPFTWMKIITSDGSTGYFPVWK